MNSWPYLSDIHKESKILETKKRKKVVRIEKSYRAIPNPYAYANFSIIAD